LGMATKAVATSETRTARSGFHEKTVSILFYTIAMSVQQPDYRCQNLIYNKYIGQTQN
jgi:hypothetical protein